MRKKCPRCQREMDCIQGEPRQYWCISCNIEYHTDRPEGDRVIDLNTQEETETETFDFRQLLQD